MRAVFVINLNKNKGRLRYSVFVWRVLLAMVVVQRADHSASFGWGFGKSRLVVWTNHGFVTTALPGLSYEKIGPLHWPRLRQDGSSEARTCTSRMVLCQYWPRLGHDGSAEALVRAGWSSALTMALPRRLCRRQDRGQQKVKNSKYNGVQNNMLVPRYKQVKILL